MQINEENWTYAHYLLGEMKAKIAIGGEPVIDSATNELEVKEIYYVSVLDQENQEISQKSFDTLDLALESINFGHQQWDFVNEMIKPSGSGCSSCAAH